MKPFDTKNVPIGIIGIGCFFPKAANLKEYWRLLFHGEDAITEVPKTHWNIEDYYDPNPKTPDHVYCKRGGFLSPVMFDPSEFGIPPSSLEATDTSQLLGLVAAKMALEDAGYGMNREFDRSRTSVILGVTGTQELVIPLGARLGHPIWKKSLLDAGISPEKAEEVIQRISNSYVSWQENSFPGLLGNVVAGRICNRLNLCGTNCVVDAACASSLSAVHVAIMELISQRSDMVVTGGVDTLNDIFMHMCFSKTQILSPTGDVRPFSKDADGTLLGEGIGILVLKRLEDAERDGDRIYAVIRAIGTSSDGKSQSIYAPRVEGQAKALNDAYQLAGVDPETVEMIEAHGTGTRVGDAVEFKTLNSVFQRSTYNKHRIALGTVKSNIGHTKAAAGAAGLIKATLALYHKTFLPTLKVNSPDPNLNIEQSPFYLNTHSRPWLSNSKYPRRAGVSSFGFGGSNYHAVLEEYVSYKPQIAWDGTVDIIAISGKDPSSVLDKLDSVASGFASNQLKEKISALAYQSRQSFQSSDPYRLLITIDYRNQSPDDITHLMHIAKKQIQSDSQDISHQVFYGKSNPPGKLAFVFPGQGSQYVNMGKDVVCIFPEAFEAIEIANRVWESHHNNAEYRLSDLIYPYPAMTASEKQIQEQLLRQTQYAQPAIGCISVAMLKILESFGLKPDVVCGHSFGELTALYAAGWIRQEDFYYLSMVRGNLMAEKNYHICQTNRTESGYEDSGMIAVFAPLDKIDHIIKTESLDVVVANRNAPEQGVLSGSISAIEQSEAIFKSKGFKTKKLSVSAGFHSQYMAHVQKPFLEALESIPITSTETPVYSNTTGKPYPLAPDQVKHLLADHLLKPVDFLGEIKSMVDSGVRTFVEIGPKSILTGLIKSILASAGHQSQKLAGMIHAISLDMSAGKRYGLVDLAVVLCILASLGYPIDIKHWENSVMDIQHQRMSIPICGANYRSEKPTVVPSVNSTHLSSNSPSTMETSSISQMAPQKQMIHIDNKTYPVIKEERSEYKGDYQRMKSDNQPIHFPLNGGNHSYISDMVHAIQEGLKSMQALQMQTADAHKKFLETQSEANRTLQQMMAYTKDLSELAIGRGIKNETISQSKIPQSFHETYIPQQKKNTEISFPSERVQQYQTKKEIIETKDHAAEENRGAETKSNTLEIKDQQITKATSSKISQRAEGDSTIASILFGIVSDLTGYPMEMLSLDQDIESDLGIDSIKRVEILSLMEEKVPGLPPITPEHMGTLKTLRDIVEYLSSNKNAPVDHHLPSSKGVTPKQANQQKDIEQLLLRIVSDLTGYPMEMLSLNQDMESDLGIDSIKRVEIFSTLEERLPGLPSVTPDVIGTMKTLGNIIDYLVRASQHQSEPQPFPSDSKPKEDNRVSAKKEFSQANVERSSLNALPKESSIESVLLTIVSELTGYPVEMLNKDQDMESDLGIDSIKRVEILSRLEEKVPGLPQISPELMGTLKTLGQIISYLSGGPIKPIDTPELVQRQVIVLKEQPFNGENRISLPSDRFVYVTEESTGLSHAIVEAFQSNHIPSRLIPLSANTQLKNAAGLVIVPDQSNDDWNDRFIKDAFQLTQSVAKDLIQSGNEKGAILGSVTRMDGAFGWHINRTIQFPLQGALAGLIKTAAVEWKNVCCHAVDIQPDWNDYPTIASLVVKELIHKETSIEVGLTRNSRMVPVLETRDYPNGSLNLATKDVIVITGGARGVTSAAAQALADHIPLVFILFGRSRYPITEPEWLRNLTEPSEMKKAILKNEFSAEPVSPQKLETIFQAYWAAREISKTLEILRSKGSAAHYYPVDIRDSQKVRQILTQVQTAFGPVKGIIHGAGVLEDKFIVDKTIDQFTTVFDTKVKGLKNVLDAVSKNDLKYLVIFSSVSARIGNKGQADYSMANEALNKIAWLESKHMPNCSVISINWGPWDGGMVNQSLKREFEKNGIELIPIHTGAVSMVREMMRPSEAPVEVVIGSLISQPKQPDGETKSAQTQTIHQADDFTVTIKRHIDLKQLPIAEDYLINGKPVVPFSLMTEWLGQGAMHANPGLFLYGLDDIRLNHPIKIDSEPILIQLLASKLQKTSNSDKGMQYEVRVEIRDGVKQPHEIIHSQAKAILTDNIPESLPMNLSFTHPNQQDDLKIEDIYGSILNHGKGLKGIKEIIRLTSDAIIAKISGAPSPFKWMTEPLRTRWVSDPLIIESAFQMASIWAYNQKRYITIPKYCKSYRQFCSKFPTDVTAIFEISGVNNNILTGNFSFMDNDKKIVAQLYGFEAELKMSL